VTTNRATNTKTDLQNERPTKKRIIKKATTEVAIAIRAKCKKIKLQKEGMPKRANGKKIQ